MTTIKLEEIRVELRRTLAVLVAVPYHHQRSLEAYALVRALLARLDEPGVEVENEHEKMEGL